MTKKRLGYQVIEDNGGNLYLAIFDDDSCIWFDYGFECDPDGLRENIAALHDGAHPVKDGWMSNIPDDYTPQQLYNELTSHEYGWEIIADDAGIYPDRMGASGRMAFGFDVWA